MRRSGVGGGMGSADGQQAFMTLPGSDTPIPVQVDYSQASKKADEKRQRNAKASTRHRRKKKTMQEENLRQLQDLKDERQQMMEEIDDLKRQRDFYRDDRNRLREIVARTPGIHQHAGGPASPSEQGSDSHAERSPGQHAHMPTPSQGYASDPSSAERPAQRRRTDDRPDFSTPVYGASVGPPPPVLASLPGASGYGGPVRPPSAASSGSGERLPPLRAMEGPLAAQGMGTGQPQEQDPRTGQWRPAQPRQYETGWATAPRKVYDGHASQWH
ncbi:Basic-leucine zipper (bZIP) transcription factor [Hirsutella rhossiliensis]|uniref:Basic-leucine zipper (BZIP) transcription factor n=1 Tax=Hirsutella rhossiliensis TaxID=111463 RepID=A0A9P8N1J3_9HYPO|nr:Basic-leucine zipper (bZIP) transcription factor [Hirsutella rhossiliensis]KAH0965953.1 Basic-leucine zipper (bZIP) transcription factor [Hirsutella rhossiliensis]